MKRPQAGSLRYGNHDHSQHATVDGIDHFLKDELRVSAYVRYADDLLLFGDDKGMLWATRDLLSEKLQTLRLRVHPDKTQIAPSVGGVGFLGFRNRPRERRLLSSGVKRFNRRRRLLQWRFRNGMTDGPRVRASLQAWLAHASKANTRGLIREIFKQAKFRRSR